MQRIKQSSLYIFFTVVIALFLMEVQVQFGSKRMGYMWAIIDPMTKVIIFSIIKVFIMHMAMPGLDFPVLLAISFFWYEFFRRVVITSMRVFHSNRALYNYKRVLPIDVLFAVLLLEFIVTLLSLMIFMGILYYLGMDISIDNFSLVFITIIWFTVFTFSIAIFSAVINTFYKNYKKFITFLFTPLMFTSGLFYTMDFIPSRAEALKEYLLYNPIIHFMEMLHGNYFRVLDTAYVDYNYMALWTLTPLFLGLFLYRHSEKKIISL